MSLTALSAALQDAGLQSAALRKRAMHMALRVFWLDRRSRASSTGGTT